MDKENNKKNIILGSEALGVLIDKIKDGTFQEILDDWKWIFSYSKKYKWAIVYYVVLGLVSSSLGIVSAIASKYLIDIITGYKTDKLQIMLMIMIGSSLFSLIFSNLLSRISTKISIYINNDIQSDIFDKIIDADWLELSKYSNGDVLNRFNSDIGTVSGNAVSWLPTILINVYNFIATFVVIMHYNVPMAFIAMGSAPFLLLASKFMMRRMREYNQKVREMSSKLMAFEVETFYNFDTIKSFGIADHYSKGLRGWQEKYKKISLDYNMFSIKTNIALSLLGMLVQMTEFCYCLYLLWSHTIEYGTMTLFMTQSSKLSGSFNSLVSIIPSFLNSSVSAHRVRELVELKKEVHITESGEMSQYRDAGFRIVMSDVNYAYAENNTVIRNSQFEANPGEIVALVGPSGEGKTTMIRLILGLIRPEAGKVSLMASNGKEVEMNADTRYFFAYVPQGNTILSGTIAENMRMVKKDATDEEIVEALKIACAWDFVKDMKDTYNCNVGERGRGLSEGQSQRIAIARAVLRDSPILLLDEATSALDVTTERRVLRNIIQQKPNKTCIVTTHRPSVLNMCQRVYRVMDKQVTELDEETSAQMVKDFLKGETIVIRFIRRMIVILFVLSVFLFAFAGWKIESVKDIDGPEISMDSDSITVSIDSSMEDILAGVQAVDVKDGDVTESMVVQGMSNFIERGRRQAVIAAFDGDNNVTKATREIIYSDYESPRFSLDSPMRFPVNGTYDISSVFTVDDCLDGDISENVTITAGDDFTTTMAGDYKLSFKVINSAGDVVELPITVTYYENGEDNRCPKVLLDKYLVYVKQGKDIKPWSYITGVLAGGNTYDMDDLQDEEAVYTRDDIQINNLVDTTVPGVYEIVYSMESGDGYRSKIRLIVIVE